MWKWVAMSSRQLYIILSFLISVLTLPLCSSCSPKEKIGVSEDPRLQHTFRGNYRTCERITIGFGKYGRFACQFNSTEFVGHFCDVVWGTYSTDSTHVYLQVDRFNKDNCKFNSLPIQVADSILFDGDNLRIFFDNGFADSPRKEESVLSPESIRTSFPTAGNKDDIIATIVIWGLALLLKDFVYIFPIGLVVLLCLLIKKSRDKKKGQG